VAAEEVLRLIIEGDSKGAQRALQELGGAVQQADTPFGAFRRGLSLGAGQSISLRDRLGLLGSGFGKLRTQHMGGLQGAMQNFGTALSGLGPIIAGVGVAIGTMGVFIAKAKASYESWMTGLAQTSRATGMVEKDASILNATLRLSSVDVGAAQAGFGLFAKAVDAARSGVAASLAPFQRLGVSLKDAQGNVRPVGQVLTEVRDRLSQIKDPATMAGIASKMFGRGYRELLPWLTKGADKIREYTKYAKDLGLEMSGKSTEVFRKYRENQNKLSLGWEAIKINAYAALVPLINRIMPAIIRVIRTAAGWLGDFRKLVEKKGWGGAIFEMVPVLSRVWDWLRKAWSKLKDFWSYIMEHKGEIVGTFEDIYQTVKDIAAALGPVINAAKVLGEAGKKGGNLIPGYGTLKGAAKLLGFQHGGIATGPKSGYPVILHGTEKITPISKGSSGTNSASEIHVHIGNLYGTDARAARQLADMVGKTLMSGVMRGMVGQNA
jgi:hypothetical protein